MTLASSSNLPFEQKTLEQLIAERDWWEAKIENATQWGGALTFAAECRDGLNYLIMQRRAEMDTGRVK